MLTVRHSRNIHASTQTLWNVLKEIDGIHKFHPAVSSSPLVGLQKEGLGAERQCNFYDGSHIKEKVTSWHEGLSAAFTVSEMNMPLKELYGRFRLTPTSPGSSKIEFVVQFTPKFGVLGWLMAQLLTKPMMKRMLKQTLKGLDDHVSTGALIGRNGVLLSA